MVVLGLDVSTSCTGIAFATDSGIVSAWAVDTSALETLDQKAAAVICSAASGAFQHGCDRVFVEESLVSFRPGFSSAATLSSLSKMNGIVSFGVRAALGVSLEHIAAQTARKLVGLKPTKLEPVKDQATRFVAERWLSGWDIPRKRGSDQFTDRAKDALDACVIALAGVRVHKEALDREPSDDGERHPADRVSQACAGADRRVEVRKGSVCAVSLSVVPDSRHK